MSLDKSIPGTGVFPVDPARKRPKRTRASAPLENCSTNAACPPINSNPKGSTSPRRRAAVTSVTQLTPPIDWDVSGTTLEKLMFHHVHRCTVPDFGLATPLAKVWSNYILPLGYYADSIKHAIIALGVAHRAFLERDPSADSAPSQSDLAFNGLAERHYRKAVSEAIKIMADPSPVNVRVTLVCCLVFVCFEIVRGQYDKAIQHLRSGSRVLESLHQASSLASRRDSTASLSVADRCLAETVRNHFSQLCDIADMFTCMGMDASMLTEADIVPDLSFFTQPRGGSDESKPFASVSEARQCLHFVELMFVEAFDDRWHCSSDGCWHSSASCASSSPTPGSQSSAKEAWDKATARFRAWCSRFELFQKALPEGMGPAEHDELRALRFSQKSWEMFNQQDGPCAVKDVSAEELHRLIDMAEDIASSSREGRPRPKFALVADVVPSLAYVCAFCDNAEVERRIVDVLRGMRRREGVWDSQEMADLYELVLQAKLDNRWKEEYNWETLPSLTRMMSNIGVSSPSTRSLVSTPLASL
ncbi:C6 zinc finger protein [Colletotrichum higginsianum]|uniref:C6 zinc finger protein n=1 Tax=Colletotrichum higginsianum (strain IMI 349063) TaxID=759273 RepID=H1VWL1_COLHI|nr:C6 zinc finger protein [Colletotrichum higginsianum]